VRPTFAVAWLTVAGLLLAIAGAAAVVIGTWHSAWLYSLLPPLLIDANAVGGAATASGGALLILGTLHVSTAALAKRGVAVAATAVVVLAALMALLCVGWGVAAVVSALSGSGPAIALLPAGVGLTGAATGYVWTAREVMARRELDRGRS
jgi:hypothetical protein